ncbi:MAG TPA: ABC transporter permease [Candidatus Gallimonas intestinavium]|uniref:ABC transporter permease n=1 Tax=Candidatus Gallimonas intestinavium TaxID=2838603 RepID=A0A9D2G2Y0_9FIRM|nr:ABC transporter permease [Candidatus Gallimonas intestinavium]
MRTYLKTLIRMFQKHLMRFLSIIFIVVVSVGLISGVGSSGEVIERSLAEAYRDQNISDLIVKSTAQTGFTEEQIAAVRARYGKENVNTGNSLDVAVSIGGSERTVRLYFLEEIPTVNMPWARSGKDFSALDKESEFLSLHVESSKTLQTVEEGTSFTLDFKDIMEQLAEQGGSAITGLTETFLGYVGSVEVTSAGTLLSPIIFGVEGEPSYIQEEGAEIPDVANALSSLNTISTALYFSYDIVPTFGEVLEGQGFEENVIKLMLSLAGMDYDEKLVPLGDLYIAFPERGLFEPYGGSYEELVEAEKEALYDLLGDDIEFISLKENFSINSLHSYAGKVTAISAVLMVAFIFVTALVVLSNMTRLMEEERPQIACLRTLGYGGFAILFKYLLFAAIGTGIGGTGAYFVGVGLTAFVYYVFNYNYAMPPMTSVATSLYFLITFSCIVIATLTATLIAGGRMVREKPADLLRAKPPKAGRKVFLERIPILWNRLSFKYKSTMRNVLRYHYRFSMTVISVACSMGIALAGLALLDLCLFHDGFGSAALIGLAAVIVIFAGLLTMVVIYTLTNINISERNREIATLMVLGYYDREVAGYIYREVYINTIVGILFGFPMGIFLIIILFKVINVGSLAGVSWFVWPVAAVIVLLFTALVTLILRRKIVGIDMNESLKANE